MLTNSGTGGAIPDSTTDGANAPNPNAGVFTSDITINTPGTISSFDSISLFNLYHTYAGDLVATLTHVDTGTSVTLFNRVEKTSNSTGYGAHVTLNGDFTFVTDLGSQCDSSDSLWEATLQSTNVTGGTFAASDNLFTGSTTTSYKPTDLGIFVGESVQGTWLLTVKDEADGDTGSFGSWSMSTTIVSDIPEPGIVPVMLAGGAMLILLQKRRR